MHGVFAGLNSLWGNCLLNYNILTNQTQIDRVFQEESQNNRQLRE